MCIVLSTMETKYIIYLVIIQETIWLIKLFINLSIQNDSVGTIVIPCHNQAEITFTKYPKFHSVSIDNSCPLL